MTDSDDTDDLLLIPPDFFIINSDVEEIYGCNTTGPYYDIVEQLIDQVGDLQDRINCIENTPEISLVSSSLDPLILSDTIRNVNMPNFQKPSFRKYNSSDDIYLPSSTQSTPQKPRTKFNLHSLPASPNINRFSPKKTLSTRETLRSPRKSSPSKPAHISPKNDNHVVLHEIDSFLSNVKTIQRINTVRNLENDFRQTQDKQDAKTQEINEILQDIDERHDFINDRLKQKENELFHNSEQPCVKQRTWRTGENDNTIPDCGAGIKQSYLHDSGVDSNLHPHLNFSVMSSSYSTFDKSSESSSDSTQATVFLQNKYKGKGDGAALMDQNLHSNALNSLNLHKKLVSSSSEEKLNTKVKYKETRPGRNVNNLSKHLGLMSLADIWEGNTPPKNPHPAKMMQKMQEEKLRRQHCEELIQELQNRNLELQQKLAVAMKVDNTKNGTIVKYQEALDKVIQKIECLTKEKEICDKEIIRLSSIKNRELEDVKQTCQHYEKEASKALNLAHTNQEKINHLEKQCHDFQNNLQMKERELNDTQRNYLNEMEKNKNLSDILHQKEIELNQSKIILKDAREEIGQSKRAVEICQAEFIALKEECARLQNELTMEKSQIVNLNDQKRKLICEMESVKNHERSLQEKLTKIKEQLESNKLELKNFYQGQVEILVQNKLTEFQEQLDKAEKNFKEEIKKREMSIAKTAAFHIQQISEKYSLEIQLLEEKHSEEKRLYNIQMVQYKQQVETLQAKLDNIQQKRVHIAHQLQKIMETQWNEALRIISSGKSPTEVENDNAFATIDQLNSLKSKSYTNFEEVFSQELLDDHHNQAGQKKKKQDGYLGNHNQNTDSTSSLADNGKNYQGDIETPVTSRVNLKKEEEIQKYIQVLLNKQPGNPVSEDHTHASEKHCNVEKSYWPHQPDQEGENKSTMKSLKRERRLGKPPWK